MGKLKVFDTPGCETYLIKEYSVDDVSQNKVLICSLDGVNYPINVDIISKYKLEWFAQVYSGQLIRARDMAREKTRKEISDKFGDFMQSLGRKL